VARLAKRDTIYGQEIFLKMVDRVTFCLNVTRFWWFFEFLTVAKPNRDTFLAKRATIFLPYK